MYEKPRRKSTVTLEEARELYQEWYEKRIVQGEPKQKSKKKGGTWVCNEALYEWWKRKITEEVKAGGRYFSIMALCSYGLKCGISEQKIRRDAYAFLDHDMFSGYFMDPIPKFMKSNACYNLNSGC